MSQGVVNFFNPQKGFGKIQSEEFSAKEIFIHFSQIQDDAKILIEGEIVNFDIEETNKGLNAKNLKRTTDRQIGIIDEFDRGYGFIKTQSLDEKYFIHHTDVIGKGFKRIEAGYEVEFTPEVSDKGLQAKLIAIRDSRTLLDKFAVFPNWDECVKDLAENLAQTEDGNWDFIDSKTTRYPILESYLKYTFLRLHKEGKLKYTSAIEKGRELKYSCFNTGLATSKQEEIFAYFEHKDNGYNHRIGEGYLKPPSWIFKSFDRESNRVMNFFAEKPELANYFQNAAELIYDTSRRLIPDYEHIIDDRERRFPEIFRALGKAQQVERVKSAIDSALIRIKRNYKTAIPQFYNDSIQLLLPLCISTAEFADVALVVAKEGEVYRANTVLPLDWAYNNARLLAKPDREWLNP